MAKRKPEIELYSFGVYSEWERNSKRIPKLLDITTSIPVKYGVEFGYVLKIKKAKGSIINLEIHHPPIKDEKGNLMPIFRGELHVNSNDFEYFQGDTVWDPLEEKAGVWELVTFLDGKEVARKKFYLTLESDSD